MRAYVGNGAGRLVVEQKCQNEWRVGRGGRRRWKKERCGRGTEDGGLVRERENAGVAPLVKEK